MNQFISPSANMVCRPQSRRGVNPVVSDCFSKDTTLIHMFAKDMNLVPRKLMDALIAHAQGQSGPKFVASVEAVFDQIGYTSRDRHYFREALDYLMSSRIEWNLLDQEGRDIIGASTFIASYEIVEGRVLEYSFSQHLLDRVVAPRIFGTYNKLICRGFTRVGGYSLYQTCKRFIEVGQTPWLMVDVWRKTLDASSPAYNETWRLMQCVVNPAIDEVNGISDLEIQIETVKEKRRITKFRFLVREKKQAVLPVSVDEAHAGKEIYTILVNDFGLNEDKAAGYVTKFPEDYIKENIEVVLGAVKSGMVRNVSGYLVKALDNDYRRKSAIVKKGKRPAEQGTRTPDRESVQIEATRKVERQVATAQVWHHIKSMSVEERASIYDGFVSSSPLLFSFGAKHKNGFINGGSIDNSPMIRAAIEEYAKNHIAALRVQLSAQSN